MSYSLTRRDVSFQLVTYFVNSQTNQTAKNQFGLKPLKSNKRNQIIFCNTFSTEIKPLETISPDTTTLKV